MLQISRKAVLALEAVLDVAIHARPDPVQAHDITKRQGVPKRYLEQVMQALVRADILRGVRGPRGGYRLARERRRISLVEIVEVIEAMESDMQNGASQSALGHQVIDPLCDTVRQSVKDTLAGLSIDDLCRQVSQKDVGGRENATDFTI
ncbi:MAG: RrF2 family transcriptional regulator [Parvibaculales bacterium]